MKAAIIEDEQVHSALLESYIKKWSRDKKVNIVCRSFRNGESFLFHWEEEADFDVIFVDIQMPGIDGMEMARRVRKDDKNIVIIFTTGIKDYMEEGYEVDAMHYLVKPINEEKLRLCLDKVMIKRKPENYILVHRDEEVLKINIGQVNYVEAMGHGCSISIMGKNPMIIKESISDMEALLEGLGFIKCHRSYLCRVGGIYRIDKNTIYFDDGGQIPVSRRMYNKVNKEFIQHFRRDERG